jgi:hypothetical protein
MLLESYIMHAPRVLYCAPRVLYYALRVLYCAPRVLYYAPRVLNYASTELLCTGITHDNHQLTMHMVIVICL